MLEPTIPNQRWWHREDILLLILLGALFFLPGLHRIPLFDRDEPRFATAARNMLESGDFIVPRFNGQLRPDKPPLVYWLMDMGYIATGGPAELGARLPSVVCGTLTLIVLYFMVGSRFGRLTGFVAALMLGTCALFLLESRMATADLTMLLGIVTCMACAWTAWDARRATGASGQSGHAPGTTMPRMDYLLDRTGGTGGAEGGRTPMLIDQLPPQSPRHMSLGMAMLFWVALAFGTLAKGVPLVFVFVPMIVLSLATGALSAQFRQWRQAHYRLTLLPGVLGRSLTRGNWGWWRELRPALGVPLLLVLVGWWVVWAGMNTHWQLITDMVEKHFLNRIGVPTPDMMSDPMKNYSRPPGMYLLAVWATFWPWSILLVPAAYHTWRRLRGKTAIAIDVRPYQFLVAWIVPLWIGLELARGKLFHYPLPLYVPLAILCADTLVQSWNRLTDVLEAPWFSSARWVTLIIWCFLGGAVMVGGRMATDPDLFWKCVPFGVGLMATGVISAMTWGKPSWPYVLVLGWGGSLLLANTMILPEMSELQVSRIAGRQMAASKTQNPELQLAVCGYEEATLIFYAGQDIQRFGSTEELLAKVPFARRGWNGWQSFWPQPDPASRPYLVAVEEKVRQELDARHLAYTEMPRLPQFDQLTNLSAYRIAGFNLANFKPVTVTVITNLPHPNLPHQIPANSSPASIPATLPENSNPAPTP